MKAADVKKITIIGAGSMGHQIAMLCALAGINTTLQDINKDALQQAELKLQELMNRWVKKSKITENEMETAFSHLHLTTDFQQAVQQTDFVIEAVIERLDIKKEVFRKLEKHAPPEAVFASNSSTIVNSKIAEAASRPEKICNMHFFFPPLIMDCVEVVKSAQTSEETAQLAMGICERIGRTGVLLQKEIYGFIANRILFALSKEAMFLYEEGYADFKDIDLICEKALNHPIGPFALADLSGIDVMYDANMQLYYETGDPADKPAPSIEKKVKAGELGRKTGKGWYNYSTEGGH
ncbi:3-hydroxyacyl-CoA dehydrogenase family protein [Alteribacillus sp. HJP-4]|uniref:3-hydroxyacyl-CoA dehydrogenase family protein n=1 Tax=Alteribacillus sp. HJP-4 TaxID=2775394 RepID=UPI0035CD3008